MSDHITLAPVDDVPAGSRVCHYDELAESAKEEFPTLAGLSRVSIDESIADELRSCEFVKYTDYYEVRVC